MALSKLKFYSESLTNVIENDNKEYSSVEETANKIAIAIHRPYTAPNATLDVPVIAVASQLQQNPLFRMHFYRAEELPLVQRHMAAVDSS